MRTDTHGLILFIEILFIRIATRFCGPVRGYLTVQNAAVFI